MREKYTKELGELTDEIMQMGNLVCDAITAAGKALAGHDIDAAEKIIRNDDLVDGKEKEIESLSLKLLLQQQPVATDLRIITAALKMVTDMERIGDHAQDISELIIQMAGAEAMDIEFIEDMFREISGMVRGSIKAYADNDFSAANSVIVRDDIVDGLYAKTKKNIISLISQNPDKGEIFADYLMIAKYCERIGDHATNIAEWVIFSVTGDLPRSGKNTASR